MKKLLVLFVLLSGILGCGWCDGIKLEWNIVDFEVRVFDKTNYMPSNGMIEGDSVKLVLDFSAEFVESGFVNEFSLITSAYAFQCPFPGEDGLKDAIRSFSVSSNADFNSIKAGESLNAICKVYGLVSIDEWISYSEDWFHSSYSQAQLVLMEVPESNVKHTFLIEIEFESGRTVQGTAEEIQWK